MELRTKKLIKNTTILSIGTFFTKVLMFVLVPILTRFITTEDYGLFDLVATYATLIIPVISIGITEATFRFLLDSNNKNNTKKIINSTFLMVLISSVFIAILVYIYSKFNNDIKSYLVVLIIYIIVELLYDTISKIVRGTKNIACYTIASIIFTIGLSIGVAIFVCLFKHGLNGLLISYIIGYLLSIIYMIYKGNIYRYISVKFINMSCLKELLKYSAPLIFTVISWWIINVSDRTIINIFLGLEVNGIYAIASKIPSLCQTFYNVFHISWVENATETINDKDSKEYYCKIYNNMIIIITSISMLLLGVNFIFYNYVFSSSYYSAINHTPILILATFFNVIATFFGGIYVAKKETKNQSRTTIISAITNIMVHLSLVKYIGLYAASISTLISYLVLLVMRYHDVNKLYKIKLNYKSIISIACLSFSFILSLINNYYINIINIVFVFAVVIILNKVYVIEIINNLRKRCNYVKKNKTKNIFK